MRHRACLLIYLGIALSSLAVRAGELPAPDADITVVIDAEIDQALTAAAIAPAGPAAPDTLLRRITLDLAGRIPTARERDWFLEQPEADRATVLVDRLMELPDFDFHLRNSLHELLMPEQLYDGEFREYLSWAVKQRRPWHHMFRDMLLARDADGVERHAARFLRSRVPDADNLTNDTAVLFFGVNISCAKCHDHPLVDDWKQDHFYGMQAFFSRTFATRKNVLTEKPFGEVKFKTTAGEEKPAPFMFLTGLAIEDKTPKFSDDERKRLEEQFRKLEQDENAGYIIFPDFSPRRSLVDAALKDDTERYLAKNIVNRVWARLMGIGIVDPPDQMHSGNPPSHPDLLAWLARDMATHDYDLRRLIRGIVLSRAYQRSAEWTSGEPPARSSFAVASPRPLTPRQLAASLLVAARNPDHWPELSATDAWVNSRTGLENEADGWSREFEQPSADFQIAVDEALFFNNNDRVQNDLLRDSDDRIVGRMKSITDDAEAVRLLWSTVLTRLPTDEEQNEALAWLRRENADRLDSLQSLTWALMAGTEMRFCP